MGCSFLVWGVVGQYLTDAAEKRLGMEPTEQDKEALQAVAPKIRVVERD